MTDDHQGQRVSRRSLVQGVASLGFAGVVSAGVLAACGTDSGSGSGPAGDTAPTDAELVALFASADTCALTVAATQGPYYFDADKVRSDIREERPGTRLRLAFKVVDADGCTPVRDAVVEIWHCDANGLYSGAAGSSTGGRGEGGASGGPGASGRPGSDSGPGTPPSGMPSGLPPSGGEGGGTGGPGGDMDLTPTDDKRYLRGAQVTNSDGIVQFVTVWPGWYRGRTVHVHVMVHIDNARVLTSQLMFDETLNSRVFSLAPYNGRSDRDTFNTNDTIYKPSMLLTVNQHGSGYLGAIVFGVDKG